MDHKQHDDSAFVKHIACPNCGSSDANALYTDGHTHCFSCGTTTRGGGDAGSVRAELVGTSLRSWSVRGEVEELVTRGITEETCRKFDYQLGKDKTGRPVQIANYRDPQTRELVAQKLRYKDKTFKVVGNGSGMPLFGQHLWPSSGRRVVVTEGEIDALSVAQASGLTWPVVSLANGAQSATSAIKNALEWLEGFETVVLLFDMDEPGQKAAQEVAPLFTPGKCQIASLPRKDANDMLKAGEVKELSQALWNAKTYRPDGIVTLQEIEERVFATPVTGAPYPWPGLTKATYGRRPGDVIGLGAGSGVGKTDLFTQMIAHDVINLGIPTGVVYMEQAVAETGRRVAGKVAGKRFWVPDDGWTQDELKGAFGQLRDTNKLWLYDSWGSQDWETVRSKLRYMRQSLGVRHVYIDHLTALAAGEDDERKALEKIMADMAGFAQSSGVTIHFVSHLATPDGKPHEEGGRVMARHFKGSRAIIYWSHLLLGMERDTQQPGTQTTLRVLKDRFTGGANGMTFGLDYDQATGMLNEGPLRDAEGYGFSKDDGSNRDF